MQARIVRDWWLVVVGVKGVDGRKKDRKKRALVSVKESILISEVGKRNGSYLGERKD